MKRSHIAPLVLAPLVAGVVSGDLRAQSPEQIYAARECGRLGISFAPGEPLVVEALMPASPAERADVQPQDTLVSVDGIAANRQNLPALSRRLVPGREVRLRLHRAGRVHEVGVTPVRDVCVDMVDAVPTNGARIAWAWPSHVIVFGATGDTLDHWVLRTPPSTEPTNELIARMRREQAEADSFVVRMRHDAQQRLDSLRHSLLEAARERARREEQIYRELRETALRAQAADPRYRVLIRAAPDAPDAPNAPIAIILSGQRAIAGVEFSELNAQLAAYFQGVREGVLVLQVAAGTPGQRLGFLPGDVVIRANGEPVHNIAALRAAIAKAGPDPVTLSIIRRGQELELVYRHDP